jgi:hypothetical protein
MPGPLRRGPRGTYAHARRQPGGSGPSSPSRRLARERRGARFGRSARCRDVAASLEEQLVNVDRPSCRRRRTADALPARRRFALRGRIAIRRLTSRVSATCTASAATRGFLLGGGLGPPSTASSLGAPRGPRILMAFFHPRLASSRHEHDLGHLHRPDPHHPRCGLVGGEPQGTAAPAPSGRRAAPLGPTGRFGATGASPALAAIRGSAR